MVPDTVSASTILWVSSKLLISISPFRAEENIDADGFTIQIY